ncbi:MAG: hypothetical protein V7646_575 [Pseudonocardia sp.]|jgi:hypothetical protein
MVQLNVEVEACNAVWMVGNAVVTTSVPRLARNEATTSVTRCRRAAAEPTSSSPASGSAYWFHRHFRCGFYGSWRVLLK